MTIAAVRANPRESAAALALIYFILIGGTEAGELSTVLKALNAVIAGVIVLAWVARVGRGDADVIDALIIFAVFAFSLSGVFSTFPRASLEAGTSALALAAAFLTARTLVATNDGQRIAFYALAAVALFLSVTFAVLWGLIWVRWVAITGQLPPLNLWLPVGAFRNWYFVTLLVAVLFPALLWLARQRRWMVPATLAIIASFAVILMSGSRTAWLAFGLAVGATALARRGFRPGRRMAILIGAASGTLVLALAAGLLDDLVARIGATSTVALRFAIWDASLEGWLDHPLVGTGPGTFGAAITTSGFFRENANVGAHADSAPIQLLSEVGLMGILAGGLVLVALVIGRRRAPSASWHAHLGLLIFLLACFTNNPTTISNITVVALVWAALITPRSKHSVSQERSALRRPITRSSAAALGLAGVLAAATTSTLVGAFAYERAARAARASDSAAVIANLGLASGLDPGHPLPHRDVGIWLAATGDLASAERELRRAIELNPGDTTALRSLAIVLADAGRGEEALPIAHRAFELRPLHEENGLTLAYVAAVSDTDPTGGGQAVEDAVARQPWLPADPSWDSWLPTGRDLEELQRKVAANEGRSLLADAWSDAAVGKPAEVPLRPSVGAITALIGCHVSDAQNAVNAVRHEWSDTEALIARLLVARATEAPLQDLLLLTRYRWGHLAALAVAAPEDGSPFADPAEDERQYRRTAIGPPPDLGPTFPTADGGLSAWLRDPAAAADRAAPLSGLARCR
jgi:O-antigen ligase/tetratricopeptide (TPR) repeat protein